MAVLAIVAGIVLGYTVWGQQIYATGGNRRAADYAGINTGRVRAVSLVFSALCAAFAGCIYIAFYRSFTPTAGQFRELDGIASVIIGGGSIFGGYGTIIGALAGAAVITLLRALLSLQIITANGSFVLPQHLGQRVHRRDPARRGPHRYLGAPDRPHRLASRSPPTRQATTGTCPCLTPSQPIVEMRHIEKSFGAVQALARRRPDPLSGRDPRASSATTRPANRR